ncbi:MAG TPA: hypothetical protein VGN82_22595 [Bosea sp. (in: a-proteobacteria)]|jgi:hypothetical protein|uniref:hypothetical protein n=1 Tax=Bosea sp. (in: a-proteobacteria) TaxID=1871050 RepID=UPI002E0E3D66|nr:hypothetical protein [Bosea sp. (in: a-proteobacteria)]
MRLSTWLPATAIAAASTVMIPVLAARPLDATLAAGVFPPWWSESEIIDAAARAGAVLATGTLPFVVIIRAEGGDAARRLSDQGALFSLDPAGAAMCARIQR